MSTRASLSGSTAEQLPAELRELWNLVDGCSRPDPEKLMAAVRRVTDLVLRQGRIQSLLQDNMSSLRRRAFAVAAMSPFANVMPDRIPMTRISSFAEEFPVATGVLRKPAPEFR